jgi:hypothetical protein
MRERERGFGGKRGGWGGGWACFGPKRGGARDLGRPGSAQGAGEREKEERERERKKEKRFSACSRNPIFLHECICTFKAIKRNARFGMVHQTT